MLEPILSRLDRVSAELARAAADVGVDPVHDTRVAIRRLLQALRVYRASLPAKLVKKMRRHTRRVLKAAAPARDADIAAALLAECGLPRRHALYAVLARERVAAARTFQDLTGELADSGRLSRWRVKLSAMQPDADAEALLKEGVEAFFAAGRAAAVEHARPEALHGFRLAVKRFRYTVELFAPLRPGPLARRLKQLRTIQQTLGERQDAAVVAGRLAPYAPRDAAAAAALAAVEERAAALEARFREFWHETIGKTGGEARWRRSVSLPRVRPSNR